MADKKSNLLVTMVFDENLDIEKQVDTELALKNQIIKYLQHLIKGKEIKHFVVADDEVINEKLTQERKMGKWLMPDKFYDKNIWRKCSQCNTHFELFSKYIAMNGRAHYIKTEANYCKICGAKMEGEEE